MHSIIQDREQICKLVYIHLHCVNRIYCIDNVAYDISIIDNQHLFFNAVSHSIKKQVKYLATKKLIGENKQGYKGIILNIMFVQSMSYSKLVFMVLRTKCYREVYTYNMTSDIYSSINPAVLHVVLFYHKMYK